jgi:hypothetical protein
MKCKECQWQKLEFANKCQVINEIVGPETTACKWQQEFYLLLEERNRYRDLSKQLQKVLNV